MTIRPPVNVTAAIILRETPEGTRVLLARRKLDTLLEPGKWEFPGGKLEPLEHPKACLKREISEELGLEIEVGEIFSVDLDRSTQRLRLRRRRYQDRR